MPDQVYLFVRVGSADASASLLRVFKGLTARVLRQDLPYLRNKAKVLWSPSCSTAWVGYVSETMVRRYIEHRWAAVLAS